MTINAIVGAEDVIDAMDLRCFGIGPRTWVQELKYGRADRLLILASGLIFAVSTVVSFMGFGRLWVPGFVLAWAGG